ncbi:hypothetical protein M406DRAFT_343692 [Cryphonectria parasitica EP155]|uniref:Xylanolytic transcriptional activator regulatory domain-containing protein n=1 Tax=Cryphonectria parasitica (strain ATCC 38755 / EP155) TaxID=660469 RepID=A0A9P5CSB1_CRYP1|nr:uncharacterized protein M406DRAFT_343692 [Cryphonectria parasitica EP155]KAF3769429.1 hypothetical protein M406DRAFT_343692 [Cryphonectria parasitica EP155]
MQSQNPLQPTRPKNHPHRPHRRSRIPLSCDPCRARKYASCKYRGPKDGATSVSSAAQRGSTNGEAMHQRIDHLEHLVKKLIAERPSPSHDRVVTPESPNFEPGPSADGSHGKDMKGPGKTVMDGLHSVYIGGGDWHAVLHEINELKSTWNQAQYDHGNFRSTPSLAVDGSGLLFSEARPLDRMEILSSLPSKPQMDGLMARVFDRKTFPIAVPCILHMATFMREYEAHWRDPSRANFIWLGLLFSILSISMLAFHQHGEPPEYEGISESLFQLYRIRTAQCLLSGDIAKCLPYTVEALRFNATAELNRRDDNQRGLWLMSGVVVRTAVNMGYHRDPGHMQGISAVQMEYRRRVWLSVIGMDSIASFLGGLPRTLSDTYSDTMEPRNLHDWELSEDIAVLPPSRPLTEATPVTYMIVKGRLFRALGRVADFNSLPSPGSYETVLDIDRTVQEAYHSVPPFMRFPPAADGNGGLSLSLAGITNVSLLALYHKGMCSLHRTFLAKGRTEGLYSFSRQRCTSSALALLAIQEDMQPSFYKLSQTRQMLTLAAMILLLELELRRKAPGAEESPDSDLLLKALNSSSTRWAEAAGVCEEAEKAHQSLAGMLSAFSQTANETGSSQTVSPGTPFGLLGLTPDSLDGSNAGISFDEGSQNLGFDWVCRCERES